MKKRLVALLLALVMVMLPIIALGAPAAESQFIINTENPVEYNFEREENNAPRKILSTELIEFIQAEENQVFNLKIDYEKLNESERNNLKLEIDARIRDGFDVKFSNGNESINLENITEDKDIKFIINSKEFKGQSNDIIIRLVHDYDTIDNLNFPVRFIYSTEKEIIDLNSLNDKEISFNEYIENYNGYGLSSYSYNFYIGSDEKISNIKMLINDREEQAYEYGRIIEFNPIINGDLGRNKLKLIVELENGDVISNEFSFILKEDITLDFSLYYDLEHFSSDKNGNYNLPCGTFNVGPVLINGKHDDYNYFVKGAEIISLLNWEYSNPSSSETETPYYSDNSITINHPGKGDLVLKWKGKEYKYTLIVNEETEAYFRIKNDIPNSYIDIVCDKEGRFISPSADFVNIPNESVFPLTILIRKDSGFYKYSIDKGIKEVSKGKKAKTLTAFDTKSQDRYFNLRLQDKHVSFEIYNRKYESRLEFPVGDYYIEGSIINKESLKTSEFYNVYKKLENNLDVESLITELQEVNIHIPDGWEVNQITATVKEEKPNGYKSHWAYLGNNGSLLVPKDEYEFLAYVTIPSKELQGHLTLRTPNIKNDGSSINIYIDNEFIVSDMTYIGGTKHGEICGSIKDKYNNNIIDLADHPIFVLAKQANGETEILPVFMSQRWVNSKVESCFDFHTSTLNGMYSLSILNDENLLDEEFKNILGNKIKQAEKILDDKKNYTGDSIEKLEDTLIIIKNSKEIEFIDYHRFTELLGQLQEAMNKLEKVEQIDPDNPVEPEEPEDPDKPDEGETDPEDPDKPDEGETDPEDPDKPDEGETDPEDPDKPDEGETDPEDPDKPDEGETDPVDPDNPDEGETDPVNPENPDEGETDPENPENPDEGETDPEDPDKPDGGETDPENPDKPDEGETDPVNPGKPDEVETDQDETEKPDDETPKDDKDDEETEDDAKPEKRTVNIVEGINRIETATEISKTYFETANHVIIADGFKFPDPLTASSLANELNGPVLLTSTDQVHESVINEIERLGATKVTIIGGELSVSKSVEEKLSGLSGVTVDRIAGEDRFETSALVAERLGGLVDTDTVLIADGTNYPDALTASPLAAKSSSPILLVRPGDMPEDTVRILDEVNPQKTIIVGGVNSVSESVKAELPGDVTRVAGDNRYETSVEIAKHLPSTSAFGASGEGFADALAIGPVAAMKSMPILLIQKNDIPNPIKEELKEIEEFVVIGGDNTISKQVKEDLKK